MSYSSIHRAAELRRALAGKPSLLVLGVVFAANTSQRLVHPRSAP
jgi:hypothetical protein